MKPNTILEKWILTKVKFLLPQNCSGMMASCLSEYSSRSAASDGKLSRAIIPSDWQKATAQSNKVG